METYQLTTLPRRLARSAGRVTTAVMLGFFGAVVVVMLSLEGAGFGAPVWIGLVLGEVAVAAGSARWYRRLSPDDRSTLRAASRRVIEPVAVAGRADPIAVPLRPGPIRRRRLRHRPDLLMIRADREGLEVPTWLLDSPAPQMRRQEWVRLAWADIERWRVTTDSEGPDTYELTMATGWAVAPTTRWRARVRIRRDEILDEVALLDHVRSVGAHPIELEASVTPSSVNRRR